MRQTRALICLGVLCAGTLWLEYEIAAALGLGLLFFVLAVAPYRAPEGHERADEFHMRRRNYGSRPISALRLPSPPRTCASMTAAPGATLPEADK